MSEVLDLIFKFLCTNSGNCMLIAICFVIFFYVFRKDDKPNQYVFCKDCRYFVKDPEGNLKYSTCSRFPKKIEHFLVLGDENLKECSYCSIIRDSEGKCGASGKYFEEREKKEDTK